MRKLLILFLIIYFLTPNVSGLINVNQYGIYTGDDCQGMQWTNITHDAKVNVFYQAKLWCSGSAWGQGKKLRLQSHFNYDYGICRTGSFSGTIFPIEHISLSSIIYYNNDYGLLDLINCGGGGCCDINIHSDSRYRSYHFYNPNNEKFIMGDTCGVSSVSIYTNGLLYNCKTLNIAGDNYNFSIVTGNTYIIEFSDGHWYEFICTTDEIYNYNICNFIYGYTCHIDWVRIYKDVAGDWVYEGLEPQPSFDFDNYEFMISNGESYKINFSDGHEYSFSCDGNDIIYNHDICIWIYPPSPYQPNKSIPWYVGFDNNIVLMKDTHGNFVENSQTAIYNKDTQTYIQKWRDTPEPYILLANNTDSNDEVIVMCKTFDGIFIIETYDPIFGMDENITWCNWTIPIMYNLNLIPIDENKNPIHDVFVSMYEYTPLNPLSFHGYDNYWGHIPIHNCSGFSRCDIKSEKIGYNDYVSTGLNWTSKNAMVKNYKHNINMVKTS